MQTLDAVEEARPEVVANGTDAVANDTGRSSDAVLRGDSTTPLNRQFKGVVLTV